MGEEDGWEGERSEVCRGSRVWSILEMGVQMEDRESIWVTLAVGHEEQDRRTTLVT